MGDGTGRDTLQSAKGSDLVFGGQGRDLIRLGRDSEPAGGNGNGNGNGAIFAARGDDLVNGSRSNDIITGGAGADTFFYPNVTDDDVIRDFRSAKGDKIVLRAFGYDGFGEVFSDGGIRLINGNAVIFLDEGTITLEGFNPSALTEDDFIL